MKCKDCPLCDPSYTFTVRSEGLLRIHDQHGGGHTTQGSVSISVLDHWFLPH